MWLLHSCPDSAADSCALASAITATDFGPFARANFRSDAIADIDADSGSFTSANDGDVHLGADRLRIGLRKRVRRRMLRFGHELRECRRHVPRGGLR